MPHDPIQILLIEDNEIDVMLIQRAFKKKQLDLPIHVVPSGEEALFWLNNIHENEELPHLILLDLNLEGMNGLEFLGHLRKSERWGHSVVFVLTTSRHEDDIRGAYQQHVAGYIVKNDVGSNGEELVNLLESYWELNTLPTVGLGIYSHLS